MPFSPQAPTVALAVLCVRSLCPLCLCGEKSVIRCCPASNAHGSGSDVHHSMLQWCAPWHPMWGTNVGHFQGSAPPPSLLAVPPYMTCIFSMSINVHMFMVNLHPLPSGTLPKVSNAG